MPLPCTAWTADDTLPDPVQEARATALFGRIRCMVCEGQSIADSNAELARDMRVHIRSRIAAGETDKTMIQGLQNAYGNAILMTPEGGGAFAFLWLFPLLGAVLALWIQRQRFRWRS